MIQITNKTIFSILTWMMLAALGSPVTAQQSDRIVRIGVLRVDTASSPAGIESIRALQQGMTELGYRDGENVIFEIRWADNKLDRLPTLAAELARLRPEVIVTSGPQAVRAARAATATIPIVMGRMDDVVEHGLIRSLARPGGNITGLSFQTGELSGKWLDLLREVLPRVARVAALWDENGTAGQLGTLQKTSKSLSLQLEV